MHRDELPTPLTGERLVPIAGRSRSRSGAKWLEFQSCATVREAGGNSSVVEHDLAKVGVAGSNPVSRSITCTVSSVLALGRRSQVAKAEVCKTSIQRFESARRLHPHHP